MGSDAEFALRGWRMAGMPDPRLRKKRVPMPCPECGKECYGKAAVMQHQNAKHGAKHTELSIDIIRDKEIYGE